MIKDYVRKITYPVFNIVSDMSLSLGESLTILLLAREEIDKQIADLRETIKRKNPRSKK